MGWDLGRTNSLTSARRRDGLENIRIWATPPKRLVFWDGAQVLQIMITVLTKSTIFLYRTATIITVLFIRITITVLTKNVMFLSFYKTATMVAVLFIRTVTMITVLTKVSCC